MKCVEPDVNGNGSQLAWLRCLLHEEIQHIQPLSDGTVARHAIKRLHAVAEYFPDFLALLVEPWLTEPVSDKTRSILADCARVHLYARILDDALDENLPVHRLNLLNAQPMLWRALHGLATYAPELGAESTALIAETVMAVQRDDFHCAPHYWGPKNHHLLLAPLLLSDNGDAYLFCRAGLSSLIALVQAGDEWRQGMLAAEVIRGSLLDHLPDLLDTRQLMALQLHGWSAAAERIVWEGGNLATTLRNLYSPHEQRKQQVFNSRPSRL